MSTSVLIVDDSALSRKIIRRCLQMAQIEVGEAFEAEDGEKALQILASKWVNMVFVDMNMPKMNGLEFVKRMAAANLINQIPVVVVSSERIDAKMEQLSRLGVKAYLFKPVRPEQVRDVVVDILNQQKGGARGR